MSKEVGTLKRNIFWKKKNSLTIATSAEKGRERNYSCTHLPFIWQLHVKVIGAHLHSNSKGDWCLICQPQKESRQWVAHHPFPLGESINNVNMYIHIAHLQYLVWATTLCHTILDFWIQLRWTHYVEFYFFLLSMASYVSIFTFSLYYSLGYNKIILFQREKLMSFMYEVYIRVFVITTKFKFWSHYNLI